MNVSLRGNRNLQFQLLWGKIQKQNSCTLTVISLVTPSRHTVSTAQDHWDSMHFCDNFEWHSPII